MDNLTIDQWPVWTIVTSNGEAIQLHGPKGLITIPIFKKKTLADDMVASKPELHLKTKDIKTKDELSEFFNNEKQKGISYVAVDHTGNIGQFVFIHDFIDAL